jgi:hypothetical protein
MSLSPLSSSVCPWISHAPSSSVLPSCGFPSFAFPLVLRCNVIYFLEFSLHIHTIVTIFLELPLIYSSLHQQSLKVSLRNLLRCPCTYSSTIHPTTSSLLACGAFCGKVYAPFFSPSPKVNTRNFQLYVTPYQFLHWWCQCIWKVTSFHNRCEGINEGDLGCNVTDIHRPTDFRKNRPFEDTKLIFIWTYTSGGGRSRWRHKTSSFRSGNSIKKTVEDIVKPCCWKVRILCVCMLMHRFFRQCALTS